jgi:hypothetical protein
MHDRLIVAVEGLVAQPGDGRACRGFAIAAPPEWFEETVVSAHAVSL